ncbi:Crp/Fnr family transcriptional regulator [Streptomyces cucumeris]|uniref:Crp/Fnr family transcriptional regulator n=1 Tax=Streptomyces cucumeris TaxID=2962890 RepID=UPI003EC01DD0
MNDVATQREKFGRRMRHSWPLATFLGRLESGALEDLLGQGTPVEYPTHRRLLQQGDQGRHVLLLTHGVVKVVATSESGYEMLLAVRVAGDFVGEMAAFEDRPRSGTVIACSDVRVRVIQTPVLVNFLTRHPDAMKAMLAVLCGRLRWANRRRVDFGAYDSRTRLARVIAELSQAYGQRSADDTVNRQILGVTLNQFELASIAGLARPTAEKALASLSQMGLVERSYRRITVCDVPKLLAFAKVFDENPY